MKLTDNDRRVLFPTKKRSALATDGERQTRLNLIKKMYEEHKLSFKVIGDALDISSGRAHQIYANIPEQFFPNIITKEDVKKLTEEELKSISTEELAISVRANNGLRNARISTLGDLITKSDVDLRATKYLGRISVNEILNELARIGVREPLPPNKAKTIKANPCFWELECPECQAALKSPTGSQYWSRAEIVAAPKESSCSECGSAVKFPKSLMPKKTG